MFRGTTLKAAALLLVALLGAQASVASAKGKRPKGQTTFKVRIENISGDGGQAASDGTRWPFALSPGLWVVDAKGLPLFAEGRKASRGLEAQAEDGNPSALLGALVARPNSMVSSAFNTPAGTTGTGPIGPGAAYEFTVTAAPGMKLSLVTMFGQSNDYFYAPARAIELFDESGRPVSGDVTSQLVLWDAGTEADQEPGVGPDQAPRQKAPNTGAAERGVVHRATGSPFYNRTGELLRVTITPEPAQVVSK